MTDPRHAWGAGPAGSVAPPRIGEDSHDDTGVRWPLVLAVVVIGSQAPWVHYGTFTALGVAVVTVRGWWPIVQRTRAGRATFWLVPAALGCGVVLVWSAPDPYLVTSRETAFTLLFIASQAAAALVAAYARVRLGLSLTLGAFATGATMQALYLAPTEDNPWKFHFGLPVGVLVVLVVAATVGRLAALAAMAGLVGVSLVNDARSLAAFFALGAVLSAVGSLRGPGPQVGPTRRQSYVARSLLLATLGYGLYRAAVRIALSGGLGPGIEQRTAEQLAVAGSVIEGGRPEWAATVALFTSDPWGIGAGVRLTTSQLGIAEAALAQRGVGSGGEYVNEYLFTSSVRLHAIVADLWVNLGPLGIVLGLLLGLVLVRQLLESTSARSAAAPAYTTLLIAGSWYVLFGPMLSNLPGVAFTAGVAAGSLAVDGARSRSAAP